MQIKLLSVPTMVMIVLRQHQCLSYYFVITAFILPVLNGAQQGPIVTNITILQGKQVRLPCPLEPDIHADVMVQWQQEGFGLGFDPDLPEYNRYKYNRSDGYCNMVIDQVHLTDSGVYTCTIYTGNQVLVSSKVTLEVLVGVSQPQILQNNPVVLVEGEKVILQCMSQGRPAPELSWQDESGSLIAAAVNSSSVRHGVDLFRTISDLPLVASRGGEYSKGGQYGGGGQKIFCMAHNSAQTRTSSISIIVQFKPEIELTQINTMGSTLQFRCQVTSRPVSYKVEWILNNKLLSPKLITDDILSLTSSAELAGARISCKAFNSVGDTTSSIVVAMEEWNSASTISSELKSDSFIGNSFSNINSEKVSEFPLYVYICLTVAITVITLLLSGALVRCYFKKTKYDSVGASNNLSNAKNRHGGPDILNNQDRLLQDLMSTRIKGVDGDTKLQPNPVHPGVEISPRSSLRSFFVEAPQLVNDADSSIITVSAKDSGVYSHKEDTNIILNHRDEETKDEVDDFVSNPLTQSLKETSV